MSVGPRNGDRWRERRVVGSVGDERVHAWIAQLVELPSTDRQRWLEENIPDDAQLRDRLLAAVGSATKYDTSNGGMAFSVRAPDSTQRIPASIGRYEVIRLLGEGGMGRVLLARDPGIDRHVAIKQLRTSFESDELQRRFWREARAAGRLHHKNIVTIFDIGEVDGQPFIVMEYVPGRTLQNVIERREDLSLEQRLTMIVDLCAGLTCAHAGDVIHRDIKPANIVIDDDGVVKILDFGIAKAVEHQEGSRSTQLTRQDTVIGTIGYIAPECLTGGPADFRSDIFSTAVVAYELLTYSKPFGRGTIEISRRVLSGDVTALDRAVSDIPPALEHLLMRGLAVEPTKRFRDMATMERLFAGARTELEAIPEKTQLRQPSPEPGFRAAPISAAAAAVGLGALILLMRPGLHPLPSAPSQAPPSTASQSHGTSVSQPDQSKGEHGAVPSLSEPRGSRTAPKVPDVRVAGRRDAPTPIQESNEGASLSPATTEEATEVSPGPGAAAEVPTRADSDEDHAAIRSALQAFEEAFANESTPHLRSIQPSLSQKELALYDRYFLDGTYVVRLSNVRISMPSPTHAVARCAIDREIVPDRGIATRHFGAIAFELDEEEGRWLITRVRPPPWW